MPYYSARLHVVCIVDDPKHHAEGKYTCDYPFVLLRANSSDEAFQRALALGREQETVYKNKSGKDVRWALNAVEEIYELGDEIDGIEVGSLMDVYEPGHSIGIGTDLDPGSKQPVYSSNVNNEARAEQDAALKSDLRVG